MDLGLKDKVVLVTGGAGGIGSALVYAFSREGAKLAIHYGKNQKRADELLFDVGGSKSNLIVQAELKEPASIADMFTTVVRRFGRIDVLVNNAGMSLREDVDIDERPPEEWDAMFQVNLRAAGLACGHFLHQLETHHNAGSVVFIGSTAGEYGEIHNDLYSTMKAGLHGLMISQASKLGKLSPPGRANMVAPGWTLTPMPSVKEFLGNKAAVIRALQSRMIPDLCRPADIVGQVLMLSSDTMARAITGQTIVVDMGMNPRTQWSHDNPRLDEAYQRIVESMK